MRIGVTRESSQLAELNLLARERGIELIAVPLIEIEQIPFVWPAQFCASSPNWVMFSSAAGVTSFFERLREMSVTLPSDVKFAAIGEKTADAIRTMGRNIDYVPSQSYGKVMFEEFVERIVTPKDVVLYPCASDIPYDPALLFSERGIEYIPLVCYATRSRELDPTVIENFDSCDYLLFTAPSAVRSYQEQFGQPRMHAVAIGNTTGSEMKRQGWIKYSALPSPDIKNILEMVT